MHRQTHPHKQDRKLIDMCFISLHWRHYLATVKNIHIALFFQWKMKCMIQLLTKLNNNAKVKTEYLGQYNLYHFFLEGGGELYCLKVYKSFSYIEQILPLYSESVF